MYDFIAELKEADAGLNRLEVQFVPEASVPWPSKQGSLEYDFGVSIA